MKKTSIAVIGLGNRGKDAYMPAVEMFPDKAEIVAAADIDPAKVKDVAESFSLPPDKCFASGEDLLKEERLADVVFICTQDRQHVKQAVTALKKGYDILLEKPISPLLDECRELVRTAAETGGKVVVCHVLRYTPFYREIKKILDAGTIGDVVTIQAIENVGYWHQAHSFVRGNWRNSRETSPMILQKCCHDMDLYLWLVGKKAVRVSSFGSTFHFKEECAPEGAALRCLDGCKVKESCPFDAEKIYISNEHTGIDTGHTGWPNEVLALHPSHETIMDAIEKGPYGRCVYHCDNDVVDHQVLNIELEDGSTVNFTMSGFTEDNNRQAKFMGTKGELTADLMRSEIKVRIFGQEEYEVKPELQEKGVKGHAGGDEGLIKDFLDYVRGDLQDTSGITSLEVSTDSHYIALAAEKSRIHNGQVIELEEIRIAD